MSKLLRIENTNMFLVVSEEEFVKKMRIDAIVRIEENSCDDAIRRYEPQTPEWHEELDKLKEIKREELYPSKDKRVIISLKTILIHYFKETALNYISVKKLCSLLVFIYESLRSKNKLGLYNIDFDIDLANLERCLLYNADIFAFSGNLEESSIIYCSATLPIVKSLTKKYSLDETILNIIQTFISGDY